MSSTSMELQKYIPHDQPYPTSALSPGSEVRLKLSKTVGLDLGLYFLIRVATMSWQNYVSVNCQMPC